MKEFKTINQNKADMEIGYKESKKMYSEEDMLKSFMAGIKCESNNGKNFEQFIKQFKNNEKDKQH